MNKKLFWTLLTCAGVGILLALISLYQSNRVAHLGLAADSFCNINAFINCDLVQASSFSKLFGVSVAGWGFLYYLWIGAATIWAWMKGDEAKESLLWVWLSSILALGYSAYMAWISLHLLHALCIVCSGMYLINLLLFIFLGVAARGAGFRCSFNGLKIPALLGMAIFGLGGVIFAAQASNQAGLGNDDLKTIVQLHFRQSEYQLEIPAHRPSWGSPDAKLVVVEFSDFQCPYCRHAANFIHPTLNEFQNKIQFYFLNYPIDASCNQQIKEGGHQFACMAAKAAICANAKGDFWSFHDDLFQNQSRLSAELIDELIAKRHWDADEFKACMNGPEAAKVIEEDVALANKLSIGGTPTIFVGNRRVKYWAYPDVLRGIVQTSLEK